MKPIFFKTPADFRGWLEAHHGDRQELLVGFHKRGSGKPSMTWPESVDEGLCFGWIDGVRRRVDATSYTIRFTPRRPASIWSAINIKRVAELSRQGRMRPAGIEAFDARADERSAIYAYEQRMGAQLDAGQEKSFRANVAAWAHFSAQPPWYRRTAAWWVVSAKKEETRARRLQNLIDCSARGQPIPQLARRP